MSRPSTFVSLQLHIHLRLTVEFSTPHLSGLATDVIWYNALYRSPDPGLSPICLFLLDIN